MTSLLFGLTKVFVAHQFTIAFLVDGRMPSLIFFLNVSVHKGTPLSHITTQSSMVAHIFQWCTLNICTMPLVDDAPTLIDVLKMQCLTTNLALEFACFVSTNEMHIPTTNSCIAITTFGGKKEFGILVANVVFDKTLSMINFLLSNLGQVCNSLSMMSIILEAIIIWSRSLNISFPTVSAEIISSWHKTIFLATSDLHVRTNCVVFLTHSWFNLSWILACTFAWIASLFPLQLLASCYPCLWVQSSMLNNNFKSTLWNTFD